MSKNKIKNILLLAIISVFSIVVFEMLKELGFYLAAIITYSLATLGFATYYICYNRGVLRTIKREDIPSSFSDAEKDAFLSEQSKRREKSKWAIFILFPLIMAFAYEILSIYFLNNLIDLIK